MTDYKFSLMHSNIRNHRAFVCYTGSNTHNNGQPAGDGQAGDDGEGKGGN